MGKWMLYAAETEIFQGLRPDWGPFGALGTQARLVIQVIMAGVLLVLLGRAFIGSGRMRLGRESHNAMVAEEGRKEVMSGLVGAFMVASMGTIFTVVYGLGI